MSESSKCSKVDTAAIMNAFINEINKAMHNNDIVVIPGFGSFKIKNVKARKGRNIKNGQMVNIPAKQKIKFTAGNKLVNSLKKE